MEGAERLDRFEIPRQLVLIVRSFLQDPDHIVLRPAGSRYVAQAVALLRDRQQVQPVD